VTDRQRAVHTARDDRDFTNPRAARDCHTDRVCATQVCSSIGVTGSPSVSAQLEAQLQSFHRGEPVESEIIFYDAVTPSSNGTVSSWPLSENRAAGWPAV